MNKKDYKRYQEIKMEISGLHQDIEDIQDELKNVYRERNIRDAKTLCKRLELVLFQLNTREVVMEELLLPCYVKIEDGMECLRSFWKDNSIPQNNDDINEFVANYLTDYFNHNVYEFNWVVKGSDIFVTKIRWNKHQLLKQDIKDVFKGKKQINNGLVRITKHPMWENYIVIEHKKSGFVQATNTLNAAIEIFESHYYM